MIVLDLFSGTGSSTQAFADRGHKVVRVELDPQHEAELHADILSLRARDMVALCGGQPDFIWASPPCTGFSVASIGTHWGGGRGAYEPKTDTARLGIRLAQRTLDIVERLWPASWLIENPRGLLRKMPMMQPFHRQTVTYCQYHSGRSDDGVARMKPTDLFGSIPGWTPRPMCKNGDPCHESAPRGAKTGTQGRKGAVARSRVPYALSLEICLAVERNIAQMAAWEAA